MGKGWESPIPKARIGPDAVVLTGISMYAYIYICILDTID